MVLFVLTPLVFIHELGHYLAAIKNGVIVEQFSVGFGPELVGFTDKHNTRWKICLIPFGGYVKMKGSYSLIMKIIKIMVIKVILITQVYLLVYLLSFQDL